MNNRAESISRQVGAMRSEQLIAASSGTSATANETQARTDPRGNQMSVPEDMIAIAEDIIRQWGSVYVSGAGDEESWTDGPQEAEAQGDNEGRTMLQMKIRYCHRGRKTCVP
jgi:hypothetical protein